MIAYKEIKSSKEERNYRPRTQKPRKTQKNPEPRKTQKNPEKPRNPEPVHRLTLQ